jgi:tripartite-type tricarboxylate transporter receptor subunit TctC
MQKRFFTLSIVVMSAMLAPLTAAAEESYPNRPIKIVVPFTPATGADILARTLGQKLSQK